MVNAEAAGMRSRRALLEAATGASEDVAQFWGREWLMVPLVEAYTRELVTRLANAKAVQQSTLTLRQRYVLQMLLELVAGSQEAVTALMLAMPRATGAACRRMVELATFAAILQRSNDDLAGRWHDHVAEQLHGLIGDLRRGGEEGRDAHDAYLGPDKHEAVVEKIADLKHEHGGNLMSHYGWAQGGTAADGSTITKKQCAGLTSLMAAAGYDVLIPIYKHLSQLYVHATALSMQWNGGTGEVGHVHIGPNPQDPDLEFLAKCVLSVLDKAAKMVSLIATSEDALLDQPLAEAADRAVPLINNTALMLQSRGDTLFGPLGEVDPAS